MPWKWSSNMRYIKCREVSGTCTSEEKKKKLEELGFEAFVFNDSINEWVEIICFCFATSSHHKHHYSYMRSVYCSGFYVFLVRERCTRSSILSNFILLSLFFFSRSLENINDLNSTTHLLLSIPPSPNSGDHVKFLKCSSIQLLFLLCWHSNVNLSCKLLFLGEDLRSKLTGGNLQWLGYLSSTSKNFFIKNNPVQNIIFWFGKLGWDVSQ